MEGTIAEIRYFAGNFAPRNWAFCQGQIMPIAQNTALFSLLGTNYGGNGQTTFGLPDLRSRIPIGAGQGPGLSSYVLGEMGGTENYTITSNNMAAHTHPVTGSVVMRSSAGTANADAPQNSYPGTLAGTDMYVTTNNGSSIGAMQSSFASGTGMTGSLQPVSSLQPVLAINPIICLQGVFPARN